MLGRLVAEGWLREVPQGRARFTVWQPRPALVRSVFGSRSRLRLAQPWHPLAVSAALVVCELAGWEVLTDVELTRMRERRSYDRPSGHPWATQSPGGPQHLPDLVLQHPHASRPIAVEVELTRKAPDRLAKLLDGYALSSTYAETWYVVPDAGIAAHVARAAARGVPPLRSLRVFATSTPWEPVVDLPAPPPVGGLTEPVPLLSPPSLFDGPLYCVEDLNSHARRVG